MNKTKLTEFLRDISFNTEYTFLEQGKDDKELAKIAEKRGIKLPAQDLAIFKGKYAFTDRTNLNGCSLPKAEVAKSLDTLVGKAIDFDHIRERIVGFWLDAELIKDTIYAYGAFFKANLAEDYEMIKDLMDKKNLGISFEAYGVREFKNDNTYDLTDIEWAGGALLINTKPAFPGAGVLEMANKRVLELASTLTEPKDYIKSPDEKRREVARFYSEDMNTMMRLAGEITCPQCGAKGCPTINSIDFEEVSIDATCPMCNCNMCVDMKPESEIDVELPETDEEIETPPKPGMPEMESKDRVDYLVTPPGKNNTDLDKLMLHIFPPGVKYSTVAYKVVEVDEDFDELALEQAAPLSTKSRNALPDKDFALVLTVKNKRTGKPRKIRMFPIHDANHVRSALSYLGHAKVQENLRKMGVSVESVRNKVLKRAKKFKIEVKSSAIAGKKEEQTMSEVKTETPSIEKAEDLIKTEGDVIEQAEVEEVVETKIETEIAEAEEEIKAEADEAKCKEEMEGKVTCPTCGSVVDAKCMKKGTEDANNLPGTPTPSGKCLPKGQNLPGCDAPGPKDMPSMNTSEELKAVKEQLAKARAEGKVIGERRSLLKDYAKDMSDDDILDEVKFENASLKKRVAELEALKNVEKSSVVKEVAKEETLEIGSKDKNKLSDVDEFAKNVRKRAFNL